MFYLFILGLIAPLISYSISTKPHLLVFAAIIAGIPSYELSSILADLSAWGDGATVKETSGLSVFLLIYPLVLLSNGLLMIPVALIRSWLSKKQK